MSAPGCTPCRHATAFCLRRYLCNVFLLSQIWKWPLPLSQAPSRFAADARLQPATETNGVYRPCSLHRLADQQLRLGRRRICGAAAIVEDGECSSAATLVLVALLFESAASDQRRQGQHYSAAQICRALATFAKGRLGVAPLQQQQGNSSSAPFFFSVNASLVGWLGHGAGADGSSGIQQQVHPDHVAAPAPSTASKVESLRKAMQLRQATASSRQVTQAANSPASPLARPALSAASASLLPQPVTPAPSAPLSVQASPSLRDDAALPANSRPALPQQSYSAVKLQDSHGLVTSARWMNDAEAPRCCECNAEFTMFNRRHHCRVCGRVVDGRCCSKFCVDAPAITSDSIGDSFLIYERVMELVCFPCQGDIEHGLTYEQAAANRAMPARFEDRRHAPHALALESPLKETNLSVAQPKILRAAAPETPQMELEVDAGACGVFGAAAAGRLAVQQGQFQGSASERAAGSIQPNFANVQAQDQNKQAYWAGRTARRRSLSAASAHHAPPVMRFSDLHCDAAEPSRSAAPLEEAPLSRDASLRSLQLGGEGEFLRRGKVARLPSRANAVARNTVASEADDAPALHDAFVEACASLDSVADSFRDPDLAPTVADQVFFDAFVEWAKASLALPVEIAATAAAAAYRLTHTAHKAAMRNVNKEPQPGIPRSLFPMLLLNFKLELQKHHMRLHAAASTAARTPAHDLQRRISGGRAAGAAPAPHAQAIHDPSFRDIGNKIQESRAQGSAQAVIAVNDIEAVLRNSGLRSEDCQQAAAELVNAGASDLRSMVRLLQQDSTTLSKAGLLPSHVLRVLRNLAKQPAFAAEAPSYRLTLSDE